MLGRIEAAQQLVEGTPDLLRERRGDGGLALAAFLEKGAQPLLGRGVEQRKPPSTSFKPASIGRPATVASERSGKDTQLEVSPRGA